VLAERTESEIQAAHYLIQFLVDKFKKETVPLCDPTALIAAIDESVIETKKYRVQVETEGKITRGMTVIDVRPHPELHKMEDIPLLDVAVSVYREKLCDIFIKTLLEQ
jgi:inosine-uridine nucleoside N-ribohydrolase